MESLGFSTYEIMLSTKRGNFTSSFLMWMIFLPFSCLISLARSSSVMLNRSGESGHPSPVPYSIEKLSLVYHRGSCQLGLYI